jgi:hypothetical protein
MRIRSTEVEVPQTRLCDWEKFGAALTSPLVSVDSLQGRLLTIIQYAHEARGAALQL